MVLNVSPGDTVKVSFTLTNTGSPVSGSGFYIPVLVVNPSETDAFFSDIYSGIIATNQSKSYSVNLPVPIDITIDVYNLEIDVWDPGLTKIIASAVVPSAVNIIPVYRVTISNISITKV